MRKDVRFGLAAGGLLVVVMAVYLVIAGTSKHNASTDQVQLVTADGTPVASDTPASPDSAAADHEGDKGTDKSAGKSETAPVAEKTPSPDHPSSDMFANGASAAPAPASAADHHSTDNAAHGDVWGTILATGHMPTLAMTETPTPGDAPVEAAPQANPTPAPAQAPAGASATAQVILDTTGGSSSAPHAVQSPAQAVGAALSGSAGKQTHRVQAGETFSTIAAKTYGNASYWPHIARANPQINPKHLKVGMVLTLPDPAEVKGGSHHEVASEAQSTSKSLDSAKEYRVQANDSLYKISLALYGKSDHVDQIYQMNRQTIGPNPAHLKLGMVLKLPEAPTQTAASH
jgi:nucleoid-associated protein YgaU